ncbi:hypothetical protein HPB50_006816 [Hyalomma asiaticum]|uniref:Uncharacterized protein n=1 Tax=Hyalomma asiaticum TaxID=266040 RepID=A0ACB7SEL2_HYAAI|nr:hypothetical protein HPB50_006816 [Hyalomma asiaticum]
MPTCFVPSCTSGYKSNPEKRHFFAPPSDPQLLERWARAIPRADKLLTKTCKVCDVHFMQHDIVKTYKHVIDGQVVEIDRGYWALQPDAVPCQFPNVPSYLSRMIKRRRSPKETASLPNKIVLVATPSVECQQEVPDPMHNIDLTQIVKNGSSLMFPKNWRMGDLEEDTGKPRQVVFYNAGMKDDVYAILKSVAIHEDLTRSVAIGFKVYRELNVPGFYDTAGTEKVTSLLNNLFDILNAKIPQAGIRKGSPKIKRFFGSFGGDEDHPTVTKFSQLFLLSLDTPVKVVKGNCESGNDRVLLSAFESLGEKRREALVRKSAMKDKVCQQLISIPFHDLSRVPDGHGYNVPSPEATALYYLAGYVAFKLKKTTRCEVCKEDALGRRDSLPKEALLVIEREYRFPRLPDGKQLLPGAPEPNRRTPSELLPFQLSQTKTRPPRVVVTAEALKPRLFGVQGCLRCPKTTRRFIVRPRGGLNIRKVGLTVVAEAILNAVGVDPAKRDSDAICPNFQQNIMVMSTPSRENATRYVKVECIAIGPPGLRRPLRRPRKLWIQELHSAV